MDRQRFDTNTDPVLNRHSASKLKLGFKTMPSHNTGLYASCLYLNCKKSLKEQKFIDRTCMKQFNQTSVLFISQSINQTKKLC
jgi:hypothetical protein